MAGWAVGPRTPRLAGNDLPRSDHFPSSSRPANGEHLVEKRAFQLRHRGKRDIIGKLTIRAKNQYLTSFLSLQRLDPVSTGDLSDPMKHSSLTGRERRDGVVMMHRIDFSEIQVSLSRSPE